MLVFIAKRLAYMVATMVAVSVLVFLLLEISPGNVATKVLGPYSSEEQRQIWLEDNGYNRPLYIRYGDWLARFVTGLVPLAGQRVVGLFRRHPQGVQYRAERCRWLQPELE